MSRLTDAQMVWSLLGTILPEIVAVAISFMYFRSSPPNQPTASRLLASAHGVSIAAIYFIGMTIFWTGHSSQRLVVPFNIVSVVPVVLMITSFFVFRGRTHWWQVLNAFCFVWAFFIGGMAVVDDWP